MSLFEKNMTRRDSLKIAATSCGGIMGLLCLPSALAGGNIKTFSLPVQEKQPHSGLVIQERFKLGELIFLDPPLKHEIIPYEICFKEKKQTLEATLVFNLMFAYEMGSPIIVPFTLTLLDINGNPLAQASTRATEKMINMTKYRAASFVGCFYYGKVVFTFQDVLNENIRRFEIAC